MHVIVACDLYTYIYKFICHLHTNMFIYVFSFQNPHSVWWVLSLSVTNKMVHRA